MIPFFNKTTYNGLPSEFQNASRQLCRRLLARPEVAAEQDMGNVSPHWHQLDNEQKLQAMDKFLFVQLLGKNMTPGEKKPHNRPDLNRFRGWLLNRIFLQLATDPQIERPTYDIPLSIEQIIEDIDLLRKDFRYQQLNDLATLNDLAAATAPSQEPFLINRLELYKAHARYLEGNRHLLAHILPQTWTTSETAIRGPGREIYYRQPGASLIAQLNDGTQVVHLKTFDASIAYGSGKWCTTTTRFDHFADHLIIVIEPNGTRRQLHFRSEQFRNARNLHTSLDTHCAKHPGLAEAIAPYYFIAAQDPKHYKFLEPRAQERFHAAIDSDACFESLRALAGSAQEVLFIAIAFGNDALIARALAHPEVDVNACRVGAGAKNARGLLDDHLAITPLMMALSAPKERRKQILARILGVPGVDINKAGFDGMTPLIAATVRKDAKSVAQLLAVPAINVNKPNDARRTALICSVATKDSKIIELLLAAPGLDKNAQDDQRQNAMKEAIQGGQKRVISQLLEAGGFDVDETDMARLSALLPTEHMRASPNTSIQPHQRPLGLIL